MDTFRVVLAAALALFALILLVQVVWGYLSIPELKDVPPAWAPGLKVSVIVAARDEERHLEAAVTSLLALSYPDYEVIVVDDRSSDRTAEILAALTERETRLSVVAISDLPAGWLGKNYALHVGAQRARGELLLFADADVMLRPLALARAVRLLQIEAADHLTVAPELVMPSSSLALVVNYGFMWGFFWARPWKTRDPRSSASLGIGAFNLVRADAYAAVGGHSRIKLRPDDDLMLGKLLKRSGHKQIVAGGNGELSIEWYRSLGEFARGLRKNAFAALQYSVPLTIGLLAANLALCAWPFAAVFITDGAQRSLYACAVLSQLAAYVRQALAQRAKPWLAVFYPIAALITVVIVLAAVTRTLRRRGIEWRGTFYPLDELRANRV